MKPILSYMLTNDKYPTIEHIRSCLEIAKKNNSVVKLMWYVQYSGWYDILIYPDQNDPEEILKNEVPRFYGV